MNRLRRPRDVPRWLRPPRLEREAAFTRLELVAVLAALICLAMVVVPALAGMSERSERLQCLQNLKRIGQAFHIWGADHGNWRPFRVAQAEGGTFPSGVAKAGNAWYEFAWVSNELVTPRILACPSDAGTPRIAVDFSNRSDGGLLHFNYRNAAVSYFLGLDIYPDLSLGLLSGDRNLQVDQVNVSCSSGVRNAAGLLISANAGLPRGWTNGVHQFSGNVLFNDGHVRETSGPELRRLLPEADPNGTLHLLMPK